ncbi:uncharacterized protein LOC119227862 [Pungitius pungitius]|uniref:uncharacterized protein LOC119227862 n=1 Tax=Pungitius pungitius TaxID=134920 RepID=UPI002E0E2AC6
MSSYTGRRQSPQRGHNSAGKINGNVYTQAQPEPGGRAEGLNGPFPIKPVYHKRSVQPSKQDIFKPYDLEKTAMTKQPRDPSSAQEQLTNGKETNGSRDPRNRSDCRTPSGELQMDRAIHAGKLMLQDKLWILAEKMRQKKQRDAAALDDLKSEEPRHSRGQAERGNPQTRSRLPEQQRRGPAHRRETKGQGRGQENFEHVETQGQEEGARGTGREMAVAESREKATHQITVPEQEVSGKLSKPRWEKVRREEDEEKNGIWGETRVKLHNGTVKAKERYQSAASAGDEGREGEKKYRERTCEEKRVSDTDRYTPQTSQQKASHEAATGGRKPSGGPSRPPASHPVGLSGPEPDQNRNEDSGLQLFPCKICKRKFAGDRLQKHVQICEKVKRSPRRVFNSHLHRIKGSDVEKFLKTLEAVPATQAEVFK